MTIGTLDEFANVRGLTTEVTRLAFQRRDGLQTATPDVPGGTGLDRKDKCQNGGPWGPAMVVIRSIFCQI